MEIFKGINQLSKPYPGAVVTIGNFDGVHLGHQRIMHLVLEQAGKLQGTSIVYTFRPHPQEVLRPSAQVQLLTTYDEKLEILDQLGIDVAVEESFTPDFFGLSAERFFEEILIERFRAQAIVVGHDFAFGKGRAGNIELLDTVCKSKGIGLTVVPAETKNQEVVSSTAIRNHLLNRNVESANALMGRPFFYRGLVVHGDARGRTIGFPTANLKIDRKLTLPYGVYATQSVLVKDNQTVIYPSVTNVGVRPTFDQTHALVETHLLDQPWIDLYDQMLEVRFLKCLRTEMKFAGIDQLKAQIALDAQAARQIIGQI